ncbi:hypothetical protein ACTMTI_26060 [Nonomuraea sp. H19]|uniref:hypothetical protein n=1 Tax=Nonomuraea sp. H19 TaxID=3452206 RepID=UPI003F8CCD73
MKVTPPSLLRRLGIALAGLAVAALTGAACALSFDDLRALAITGEARRDLAYLYPAAFDALLVVAMIGVLLLRSARLLVRIQAAIVLVLLIAAAAAADVATAVRFTFDARQTAVGVALAPWVMLALALWLWLLLIKHVQANREPGRGEDDDGTAEQDILPFHRGRPAETPPPLDMEEPQPAPAPVLESAPLVGPTAAPQTPPVSTQESPPVSTQESPPVSTQELPPVSTQVTEWPAQEPVREAHEPVREAHEPVREAHEPTAQEPDQEPVQDPVQDPAAQEPQPETRPVRWGDRVKPADVLVHPRPDDRDADTQPHPVFENEEEVPDPGHGPDAADTDERRQATEFQEAEPGERPQATERPQDESADTTPHPVIRDDTPAPSGRVRSTPRPPED